MWQAFVTFVAKSLAIVEDSRDYSHTLISVVSRAGFEPATH